MWNYDMLYIRFQNQTSLRNTVASTETVKVLRHNGELESISSVELVPGDIIELPRHHGIIVCDAVLLSGTCIVNESMLTGKYLSHKSITSILLVSKPIEAYIFIVFQASQFQSQKLHFNLSQCCTVPKSSHITPCFVAPLLFKPSNFFLSSNFHHTHIDIFSRIFCALKKLMACWWFCFLYILILSNRNFGGKPVLAKVIRTGLQTNKGGLVAAILYPPPADFKFDQDSYKFMGILAVIALGGFIYTVISKVTLYCSCRYNNCYVFIGIKIISMNFSYLYS